MRRITEIIVSILTVVALVVLVNLNVKSNLTLSDTIKEMEVLLDIYRSQNSLQFHLLNKAIKSILEKEFKQDKKIKKLEDLIEESLHLKSLDVEKIMKANVKIVSLTSGYSGSGTHIKLNGKSYILTCGHLFKSKNDLISVTTNEPTLKNEFTKKDEATIVLLDKEKDLALIKLNREWNHPYLKIADKEPSLGEPVWVVGNPYVLNDVITFGKVVSYFRKDYYILSAKAYYGNSGGCVINRKGEIVGVLVAIEINLFSRVPLTKKYGIEGRSFAVRLNTIKKFLEKITLKRS